MIFPLAVKLPGGWDMGLDAATAYLRNEDYHGYHTEFINSATFGHDLFGKLGGYAEFFSSVSTEGGSDWVGTLDFGLTYGLTDNIQFDCGVNLGRYALRRRCESLCRRHSEILIHLKSNFVPLNIL